MDVRTLGSDAELLRQIIALQDALLREQPSTDEVLARVTREALVLTGAAGAAAVRVGVQEASVQAAEGLLAALATARAPREPTLAGRATRARHVLHFDGARRAAPPCALLGEHGAGRAVLLAPVYRGDRAVAALVLVGAGPGAFAARHVALLKLLARMAGVAKVRAAEAAEKVELITRLGEAEARFQAFMDHAPMVSFMKDAEGRFVYANRPFAELFGTVPERVRGRTDFDHMPPDAARQVRANDAQVRHGGRALQVVEDVPGVDGRMRHWLVVKFPFADRDGAPLVGGVGVDVTERLEAEAAREREAAVLEGLFAASAQLLGVVEVRADEHVLLRANPASGHWFGARLGGQMLLERSFRALGVPEPLRREFATRADEAHARGGPVRWELRPSADLCFVATLSPLPPGPTGARRYCYAIDDVSAERQAEAAVRAQAEALAHQDAVLRSLFEVCAVSIGMLQREGDDLRVVLNNPAGEAFFHLPAGQLTGRSFRELGVPEDLRALWREHVERAEQSGESVRFEYVRRNGHVVVVTLRALPRVPGQPGRVCYVVDDVTEHRRAKGEVERHHALMRGFYESCRFPLGVLEEAPDGEITLASGNPAMAALFGQPVERMAGFSPVRNGGQPEVSRGFLLSVREARRTGEPVQWEYARGAPEAPQHIAAAVAFSGWVDGRPRYTVVLQDVTERKRAEAQQLLHESTLRQSLREKEVLLKEVHHRVKNNLQVIVSLLSLQARGVADPRVVELFRESQARVRSMALVHEKFYRARDLGHVDLLDYLRDLTHALAHGLAPADGRVRIELAGEGVMLGVDAAIPCGLVVNELVTNALKHAFPDGRAGRVTVRVAHAEGGRVALSVEDDGVGLPPALALESAATLGLQIVSTLADQLDAELRVERTHGTRFLLTFAAPGARAPRAA